MLHAWYSLLLAASLAWTGQPFSIDHPTSPNAAVEVGEALQPAASSYPPAVQDALRSVRKAGGHTIVRADKQTYVVIGAGQRPTGGYRLIAERIERKGTHGYVIHVREQKPAAGAMKTQVISFPTLVVTVPDSQAQIQVVFR